MAKENSDRKSSWKMEQSTKENGSEIQKCVRARVLRFGLTEACMKDGGPTAKQMGKGGSSMLTVIFMTETGLMIRLMAGEFTLILMEPGTKAIGRRTNSMVKDWRPGLMALLTKVIT